MHKPLLLGAVITSVFLLVGCGSSNDAETQSQAITQSAVERCDDIAVCVMDGSGEKAVSPLHRENGDCYAGGLKLGAGGHATGDDVQATWSETSDGFDICVDGGCMRCTVPSSRPEASPDAPPSSGGTCEGSASSCYSRAAGTCSGQEGCDFVQHSHLTWDNQIEFTYECEGTPKACSSFTTAASCGRQSGCSWK